MNGGSFPRGEDWKRVVNELAARVGVAPSEPLLSPTTGRVLSTTTRAVLTRLSVAARVLAKEYPGRAIRALRDRGISDETMAIRGLGYCSDVEEWLDVAKVSVRDVEAVPGWPEKAWLWNDRIVGPWRRANGDVCAMWGRALEAATPKYLVSGERALLYGHDRWLAPRAPRRLCLVEGLLNTCELESAGVKDVCALGGTHFSTEAQEALLDAGVERVLVVFDRDAGGEDGARVLARQMAERPTGLRILITYAGKGNPVPADLRGEADETSKH